MQRKVVKGPEAKKKHSAFYREGCPWTVIKDGSK